MQSQEETVENQQLIARIDTLKANRANIESKWNEIDPLILPLEQGNFAASVTSENSKDWSTLDVWDSTAPIGADRLAAMLHSTLLSGRWLGAKFGSPAMNKNQKWRAWLDDTVDRIYNALMVSNFISEMASCILEWVGYGNMAISMDLADQNEWRGFEFGARPIRSILFEEDWTGRPVAFYFPLRWSPTQIVSKFRDPDDKTKPSPKIPEGVVSRAKLADGATEKLDVLLCFRRREDAEEMTLAEKTRAAHLMPFEVKYILREGAITLEEGGLPEMRTFLGRYARSATSMWGYGPSLLALPTVKLLNTLQETVVNAGAKAVDPATLVTERGLLSDLDLAPGGQTVVRSIEDVVAFESKSRFDVSESLLADHRNMVRKHFREDDITLKDSPAMTATEVNRRFVLLNRFLSPPVKRLQYDVLAPIVQAAFNMMWRLDQIAPLPEEGIAPRVQIEFFGPLMTAMRDDEVSAIERLLVAKASMTKMDPGSAAKFVVKDDIALREMAERLAVPAAMLADEQEVQGQMKKQAEMQQAAQAAEVAKTGAEARRAEAGAQKEGMAPVGGGSWMGGMQAPG